jgi:hypothetical protein
LGGKQKRDDSGMRSNSMMKNNIFTYILIGVLVIIIIILLIPYIGANQVSLPTATSSGFSPRHWITLPDLRLPKWGTWTVNEVVYQQADVSWNDPLVIAWLNSSLLKNIEDIEEYRIAGSSADVPDNWTVQVWIETDHRELQGKFPISNSIWEGKIKIVSSHPDMILIMELLDNTGLVTLVRQIAFIQSMPQQ